MMKLQISLQAGMLVYDKKGLKAALRQAGKEVADDARKAIRARVGGGRLYRGSGGGAAYRGYKAGHYDASIAGASPVSVTGTLARSMKVILFKSGEGVAIRDTMFYALFLEGGAQGGVGSGGQGSTLSTRKKLTTAQIKAGGLGISRTGQRNVYKQQLLQAVVGSRVLEPRPFLTEALAKDGPSIGPRLMTAVVSGISWKSLPTPPVTP